MADTRDRFRGCLLGLAVGDALGTTVEFKPRGSFPRVTGMTGGGPFRLAPGQWTDDTSMALCLAASLVERGFDPADQMERYCRWWQHGYMSSTGRCFDIGMTTRRALGRYRDAAPAFPFCGTEDPEQAGNGSIMRLAPVPMFFYPDERAAGEFSGTSSRTTHGAAECVDAARLLGAASVRALSGREKREVLLGSTTEHFVSPAVAAIASGKYLQKSEDDIRGSGYVIASLEAALWCFARTDSFSEAVLTAVNLGDDADTTGAVCGQIAGAFYGESRIPESWRERLFMAAEIRALADTLYERASRSEHGRRS